MQQKIRENKKRKKQKARTGAHLLWLIIHLENFVEFLANLCTISIITRIFHEISHNFAVFR